MVKRTSVWGQPVNLSRELCALLENQVSKFKGEAIEGHKKIIDRALKNGRSEDAYFANLQLMAMERMTMGKKV